MKMHDRLSLNKIILYLSGNSLTLQRVGPVNRDELNELRELDKKGLAKFLVIDASTGFIAHKDVEQKLIDDLSNGGRVFSEIVDRSQQGHSLVQIYASKIWLRKSTLTPDQFEKLVQEEDLLLENYNELRLK